MIRLCYKCSIAMWFCRRTYSRKFYPQEEDKPTLLYSWLYRAVSVFYFDIWACNSKFTYKIIFKMTSNWHRRFWRIFYLPFPWLQSTWHISLYEVEHCELPRSGLSMWQVWVFSSAVCCHRHHYPILTSTTNFALCSWTDSSWLCRVECWALPEMHPAIFFDLLDSD